MAKTNFSETVTVRVAPGTPEKIRAITGQPFSRVVRWLIMALMEKHAAEDPHRRNEGAGEVRELVQSTDDYTKPEQ